MMDTAAQFFCFVLYVIILVRTEPALNRMSGASTPMSVRLSFALLATGAVAGMIAIFSGKVPDLYTIILAAGTAAFTFCERRIRLLTGHQPRKEFRHAQR